jgi:hypothetical protein
MVMAFPPLRKREWSISNWSGRASGVRPERAMDWGRFPGELNPGGIWKARTGVLLT